MITKIFDGKKITIRELTKNDLKNAKKFQDFINSLVDEDAMILAKKKYSLKEEKGWLKGMISAAKNKKVVYFLAEDNKKIVGAV
jgi:hypothetical protein